MVGQAIAFCGLPVREPHADDTKRSSAPPSSAVEEPKQEGRNKAQDDARDNRKIERAIFAAPNNITRQAPEGQGSSPERRNDQP